MTSEKNVINPRRFDTIMYVPLCVDTETGGHEIINIGLWLVFIESCRYRVYYPQKRNDEKTRLNSVRLFVDGL